MCLKIHSLVYVVFFIVFLIASVSQESFAQSDSAHYIINKKYYSLEDGLASREVFCGKQDNNGFIWFGTRNGLSRFDGKNFILFTMENNGLRGNKIVQLSIDNANHLFIEYGATGYSRLTNGVVDVMDLTTHKVESFAKTFPNTPFKEKNIYWITNDGTDKLCILTAFHFQFWNYSINQGFKLRLEMKEWDTLHGTYYTVTGPYDIFRQGYAMILLYEKSKSFFITPDTVYEFPPQTDGEASFPIEITKEHELIYVKNIPAKNHHQFFKLDKQFHIKEIPGFDKYQLQKMDAITFNTILADNEYSFLIKSDYKGIFLQKEDAVIKLVDANSIEGFNTLKVYQNFIDNQGRRWISTSFGAIEVKIERNRFHHYFTKEQQNIEQNNQVRGIYADSSGKVYANVWQYLFVQDGNKIKTIIFGDAIMYALCKYNGKLYTGYYSPYIYDETKNKFTELGTKLDMSEIWAIHPFSENKLLLGGSLGIGLFDLNTNTKKEATSPSSTIPQARFVYRFLDDSGKKIWAVADKGLYVLDTNANIAEYYGDTKDSNHHLPFTNLHDMFIDRDGIFWIATNGGGLYRWDRNKNTFQKFNITNGFPSDILYRIESDKFDNLWISTDNGLVRFNTKNFRTNIYTTRDGISHNEFNRASSFKADDGRLFFGGMNGVNEFNPEDFIKDTIAFNAPLRIVAFNKYSGKDEKLINLTTDLLQQNKIVLQPDDRFFTLEFILLNYETGKTNYAYKIQGIDKDWNYIRENSIRISGLPYGEYILDIKGQSNSGEWSKNELHIPVSVQTPLIRKLWFQIILGLLFLALIYILFKWRTRQLLKSKVALEKTVSDRTIQLNDLLGQKEILLKEIHHRVKNNLQVISSLLELQSSGIDDEKAKAAITEGQNRVRSIALIHHRLYQNENLDGIELKGFIEELFRQVVSVFFTSKDKIKLLLNIPETDIDIDTVVPLGLIANEILTNACKYAFNEVESGILKIDLLNEGNGNYTLTFKDNGPGMLKEVNMSQQKSLGLRLIKRLSKQIGGSAEYHFDNGSVFVIKFKDTETRKES